MTDDSRTATLAEEDLHYAFSRVLRLFEEIKPDSKHLRVVPEALKAGQPVQLGGLHMMGYDRRAQIALRVDSFPRPRYLLVREIDNTLDELCHLAMENASEADKRWGEAEKLFHRQMEESISQIITAVRKYGRGKLSLVS